MNLKYYLLSRILGVVGLCLTITVGYFLYQNDRILKHELQTSANALSQQLQVQLLQFSSGLHGIRHFPDFDWWKEKNRDGDICINFVPADNANPYQLCREAPVVIQSWPAVFESVYRLFFNPEATFSREVVFNRRYYGVVTVSANGQGQLAKAWHDVSALSALAVFIATVVGVSVYIILSRALAPALIIRSEIDKLRGGNLNRALPVFKVSEWQFIGTAITIFAEELQRSLKKRRQLMLQLFTAQEQERRLVAGELHDELGQYLVAANAATFDLSQLAKAQAPGLSADIERLDRINRRVMEIVRSLLQRLHPNVIDQAGLKAALEGLVTGWQDQMPSIRYNLKITGDCRILPEPLPIVLYRMVQEGLTNVIKHSNASTVEIMLAVNRDTASVTITDNGSEAGKAVGTSSGFGLLGIQERAEVLNGHASFLKNAAGFSLHVKVPLKGL